MSVDMQDWPVISEYTDDQAIEDGVLIHAYPERFPYLLVSREVHAACRPVDGDVRTYDQRLIPLMQDAVMAVRRDMTQDPPVVLENTVAGTVWVMPNGSGGLTILHSEEH